MAKWWTCLQLTHYWWNCWIVVGNVDFGDYWGVIIHRCISHLQWTYELCPLYLPLQCPILFLYGENGYHEDIMHSDASKNMPRKKHRVTIHEYMAYKLQIRFNKSLLLRSSKKRLL